MLGQFGIRKISGFCSGGYFPDVIDYGWETALIAQQLPDDFADPFTVRGLEDFPSDFVHRSVDQWPLAGVILFVADVSEPDRFAIGSVGGNGAAYGIGVEPATSGFYRTHSVSDLRHRGNLFDLGPSCHYLSTIHANAQIYERRALHRPQSMPK